MLLKSYAFQPFQNQAAYLRSNFNRLDVVVVAASLLTLIFNGVGALKALRLLRYVLGLSQIQAHRFISQLVTVRTDYGDCCPYIVQYTPNTGLTLCFTHRKDKTSASSLAAGFSSR